jgi:hypothetical protein
VLPTLTSLHVHVESRDREGEDVLLVIPYVARSVSVLQDIGPIRSILIGNIGDNAEILTWTTPGADVNIDGPAIQDNTSRSACFMFAAHSNDWHIGVSTGIFDALLTLLPLDSVSTLTARNHTRLSKGFWLRHASRLPLLEQARLVSVAIREFWEMLAEDIPLESRLGWSTTPHVDEAYPPRGRDESGNVASSARHTHRTRGTRSSTGVPRFAHVCCNKIRNQNVRRDCGRRAKTNTRGVAGVVFFESFESFLPNLYGGIRKEDKDEFDDGRGVWYGDSDNDSYEDEDDRFYGDESEDEDEVDYGNYIM